MVASIKVNPNYMLKFLILSCGEKGKLISPNSIQDMIHDRIQGILNKYD
jgi:hypothetical protein